MSKQEAGMPWGKEMLPDAMPWCDAQMSEKGEYHTDRLKEYLTDFYKDRVDPTVEMENGTRSLWSNYVDWLTAYMTGRGLHQPMKPKIYRLTPLGEVLATGMRDGQIIDPVEWVEKKYAKRRAA